MTRLHDVTLGKSEQFNRVMAKAGLDGELVDAINQQQFLADGMVRWLREQINNTELDPFAQHLLTLDQQLARIRDYNSRFWDNRLTAEQLDAVDTTSTHVQHVNDLEILHVCFGSPKNDVDLWWKAIAGVQPEASRWDMLKTGAQYLRVHELGKLYPYGIHRVHIDLMANWLPQIGRSARLARSNTLLKGRFLAHAEVLSAYGLHSELLREQDGTHLPSARLAGYEASHADSTMWQQVTWLWWSKLESDANLATCPEYTRAQDMAAPVVW